MHQLVASPFLDGHMVARPGHDGGLKLGAKLYAELQQLARANGTIPTWLSDGAARRWDIDLAGQPMNGQILVRDPSPYGYSRASWEINLGCDYDCEHCYLGEKRFEGLTWEDKQRLLEIMRDAGALVLQLTGGEPLIDPHFPAVYQRAYELGMLVTVSSNGSQLHKPKIIDLLTRLRPYRLTLSLYGATAASYDGLTRNRGAFDRYIRGLDAAREADLPVKVNIVVTEHNAHEVPAMEALVDRYGFPRTTYTNMSPTIAGEATPLPSQSMEHFRQRKPFSGCNAGHTFFHADPFGKASICKVGRDPNIDLIETGVDGLAGLGQIADSLQLRTGGCSGCALSGTCWTCRPMAKLYQESKAPLSLYCQHAERK